MENTLVTIKELVSEAQCYEAIRKLRWQENISCPHCNTLQYMKRIKYPVKNLSRNYFMVYQHN
jgi:hypothetical protein